jgi:hypothetical protein
MSFDFIIGLLVGVGVGVTGMEWFMFRVVRRERREAFEQGYSFGTTYGTVEKAIGELKKRLDRSRNGQGPQAH